MLERYGQPFATLTRPHGRPLNPSVRTGCEPKRTLTTPRYRDSRRTGSAKVCAHTGFGVLHESRAFPMGCGNSAKTRFKVASERGALGAALGVHGCDAARPDHADPILSAAAASYPMLRRGREPSGGPGRNGSRGRVQTSECSGPLRRLVVLTAGSSRMPGWSRARARHGRGTGRADGCGRTDRA